MKEQRQTINANLDSPNGCSDVLEMRTIIATETEQLAIRYRECQRSQIVTAVGVLHTDDELAKAPFGTGNPVSDRAHSAMLRSAGDSIDGCASSRR
jgi:hypothetical protein